MTSNNTFSQMNSLQDHWREYRDACYPTGIPAEQNLECHQAFFAGCLVALRSCTALAAMTDDDALRELQRLLTEAETVCAARAQTLKERN